MHEQPRLWDRVLKYVRDSGGAARPGRVALVAGLGVAVSGLTICIGIWLVVVFPMVIVSWTVGGICVSSPYLDCLRAVADARQSVLFSIGGLIAIVGLYFTYEKWKHEEETTRVAVAQDRRAVEAHERERANHERERERHEQERERHIQERERHREQMRHEQEIRAEAQQQALTLRINDALARLESPTVAQKVAAIHLLAQYALETSSAHTGGMILNVLTELVLGAWEQNGIASHDTLMLQVDRTSRAAIDAVLTLSSSLKREVDLSGIALSGLDASRTDWGYVRTDDTSFLDSDFTGASFRPGSVVDRSRLKFTGCKLDEAVFTEAALFECHFWSSDVNRPTAHRLSFNDGQLRDCTFTEMDLDQLQAHGARLENVIWTDLRLDSPNFGEAVLKRCAIPRSVEVQNCNFSETTLFEVDLGPQDPRARFSGLDTLHAQGRTISSTPAGLL